MKPNKLPTTLFLLSACLARVGLGQTTRIEAEDARPMMALIDRLESIIQRPRE